MAIVNATENPPLATAVRGYDRAAVDDAIARETAALRDLESRAAALERELVTPPTTRGTPIPRQKVQQALDVMGDGWDEAIRITAAAEYAASQDRAHAEHLVALAMATLEDRCLQAERTADDTAKRMVASTRDEAARLLEQAAAEHDRAVEAAVELAQAAENRAKELAVKCAAELCDADERQAQQVAARYNEADRDVAAAEAELAAAQREAAQIAERAQAERQEILAQGRAAAEEVLFAAGAEVRRRQEEIEAALAELGRLLIATGGQLVSPRDSESTERQLQMTRSVGS